MDQPTDDDSATDEPYDTRDTGDVIDPLMYDPPGAPVAADHPDHVEPYTAAVPPVLTDPDGDSAGGQP